MDKELKNYLRKTLKKYEFLLEKFRDKSINATDLNGKSIFDISKDTICVLVYNDNIENLTAGAIIEKYEQVKQELAVIKNLEEVLINGSTDKILDWRFLVLCLVNIKDNIILSYKLITLIVEIIRKDSKDYFLNFDTFHTQEKSLNALIDGNFIISVDKFSYLLASMLIDYLNKFSSIYSIGKIELLDLTNVIIKIFQTIEKNRIIRKSTEELKFADFNKPEGTDLQKRFDIKRLIDEEFKKYSYLFTNIKDIEYFIEYLRQLTSDELLISSYREKALNKYHSFLEEQKEYTLQDIYKEDYQVIKDSKALNVPEINSIIADIYIMADMYFTSSEEEKEYLLEEFQRYMLDLKELVNKYSKKEEKIISNVIYYTYKNDVVVYEQLKNTRKESYFDYYNSITKIINNKIRGHELQGTNYGEPVYYIGKDSRVFYIFAYDIPVIISIGEFNDAIKIVNSKEFKEFINSVKDNLELYLDNEDDNSRIMSLLSSSKKVARKLSNE